MLAHGNALRPRDAKAEAGNGLADVEYERTDGERGEPPRRAQRSNRHPSVSLDLSATRAAATALPPAAALDHLGNGHRDGDEPVCHYDHDFERAGVVVVLPPSVRCLVDGRDPVLRRARLADRALEVEAEAPRHADQHHPERDLQQQDDQRDGPSVSNMEHVR